MKENEQRLLWQRIMRAIKCPLSGLPCRKNEGAKTYEKRIEHDTVIYEVQCNYCSKKSYEWGYDQFVSSNDLTLKTNNL